MAVVSCNAGSQLNKARNTKPRVVPRNEHKAARTAKSSRTHPAANRAASIHQFAEHARRAVVILRGWNRLADQFAKRWAGFNAIYNAFSGAERERLMAAVASGLTEKQARGILLSVAEAIAYFAELPPGDLRRAPTDERFRARTRADMRAVEDTSLSATTRLAHLLSVVYQVRCNLVHGGKNAADPRSARLINDGELIVRQVFDRLIANASAGS